MTKAYSLTLLVIDQDDEVGDAESIRELIEHARYPNRCITPHVMHIKCADIGEFTDDHPLNKQETFIQEFHRIFPSSNILKTLEEEDV